MQLSLLLWYEWTDVPEGLSIIRCTLSCDGEVEIFSFVFGISSQKHITAIS